MARDLLQTPKAVYARELYASNPSVRLKAQAGSRKKSKSIDRRSSHKNNRLRRLKVIAHYSEGSMSCQVCGFDDLVVLQIDHIEGGGVQHRKLTGSNTAKWLIDNGFPEGYRILCANCNMRKRYDNIEFRPRGEEPHVDEIREYRNTTVFTDRRTIKKESNNVSKAERETIIGYDESEDPARIFTHNRKLQNRLIKLGFEADEDDGKGGLTFEVPKEYLRLPSEPRTRVLTEEQLEASRDRLAKARDDRAAAKAKADKKAKKVAPKSKAKAPVEDDDDEEEEEEAPPKKKAKPAKPTKKAKAVVEDDDDDDDDDDEPPAPKAKKSKPKAKAPVEDDDDDDEDDEVEVVKPAKKKKGKGKS